MILVVFRLLNELTAANLPELKALRHDFRQKKGGYLPAPFANF
jgi:hypothetical protein